MILKNKSVPQTDIFERLLKDVHHFGVSSGCAFFLSGIFSIHKGDQQAKSNKVGVQMDRVYSCTTYC